MRFKWFLSAKNFQTSMTPVTVNKKNYPYHNKLIKILLNTSAYFNNPIKFQFNVIYQVHEFKSHPA